MKTVFKPLLSREARRLPALSKGSVYLMTLVNEVYPATELRSNHLVLLCVYTTVSARFSLTHIVCSALEIYNQRSVIIAVIIYNQTSVIIDNCKRKKKGMCFVTLPPSSDFVCNSKHRLSLQKLACFAHETGLAERRAARRRWTTGV